MNAHPGLPSGTATNLAPFGKSTAMRALPKLNDGRPGTGCNDVFDPGHGAAVGEPRTTAFPRAGKKSSAPTTGNVAIAIGDDRITLDFYPAGSEAAKPRTHQCSRLTPERQTSDSRLPRSRANPSRNSRASGSLLPFEGRDENPQIVLRQLDRHGPFDQPPTALMATEDRRR